MRIISDWLYRRARRVADSRPPDFVVGGADYPYLRRWHLIPRNRWLNVYLHQFLRDDDDRALHDHMYPWCSILIHGAYVEHTIAAGGVHRRKIRWAPSIKASGPWRAHRIELLPRWFMEEHVDAAMGAWFEGQSARAPTARAPAWTIFITGPRMRNWGFHCPDGWVPWQKFTAPGNPGETGRGCGED